MYAQNSAIPPQGVYIPEHYSGTAFRYPPIGSLSDETDGAQSGVAGRQEEELSSAGGAADRTAQSEESSNVGRTAEPSRPTRSWREGAGCGNLPLSQQAKERVDGTETQSETEESCRDMQENRNTEEEAGSQLGMPAKAAAHPGLPSLLQGGGIGAEELLILGVALLILEEGNHDTEHRRADVWVYLMLLLLL